MTSRSLLLKSVNRLAKQTIIEIEKEEKKMCTVMAPSVWRNKKAKLPGKYLTCPEKKVPQRHVFSRDFCRFYASSELYWLHILWSFSLACLAIGAPTFYAARSLEYSITSLLNTAKVQISSMLQLVNKPIESSSSSIWQSRCIAMSNTSHWKYKLYYAQFTVLPTTFLNTKGHYSFIYFCSY